MARYAVVKVSPTGAWDNLTPVTEVEWLPARFDAREEAERDAEKRRQRARKAGDKAVSFVVRETPELSPAAKRAQAYVFATFKEHCGLLPDDLRHRFAEILTGSKKGGTPMRLWTDAHWLWFARYLRAHVEACEGGSRCDVLLAARDRLAEAQPRLVELSG